MLHFWTFLNKNKNNNTNKCIIVSTNITNKTVFNTDKNNQPLR